MAIPTNEHEMMNLTHDHSEDSTSQEETNDSSESIEEPIDVETEVSRTPGQEWELDLEGFFEDADIDTVLLLAILITLWVN